MIRKRLCHKLCVLQFIGFGAILAVIWLGELLDLPFRLFGAESTPINYVECIYESGIVVVLAVVVMAITRHLTQKIQVLEGMLAVCAHCKRIRVEEKWVPIEGYIAGHSNATFSHSFCPECLQLHYSEVIEEESQAAEQDGRPVSQTPVK